MAVSAVWRVEAVDHDRFPYRVSITEGDQDKLVLRTQAKWPGPGSQVFCLRETEAPTQPLEVVEEVPVAAIRRFGRKLSITLDRNHNKRCDFLFLKRPYKNRPGEYEQIFFRTQKSLRQHKSRGRKNLFGEVSLSVVVDSRERYPWKFGNAEIWRRPLPAGDYALLHADRTVAVVERKTFDNLLQDIGSLQLLHQQFAELATYPHASLVIEAQYADFLDPKRITPWSAAHIGRVLAELAALHPELPVIYAGNRKFANQWALGFFEAVSRKLAEPATSEVAEVAATYNVSRATGGDEARVRYLVAHEMPDSFSVRQLQAMVPEIKITRLRTLLGRLRDDGVLQRHGHGRAARWHKVA